MTRVQRQSEAFKKGEPDDHELAVGLVCNYIYSIKRKDIWFDKKAWFEYPREFRVKKDYPEGHTPDLTVWVSDGLGNSVFLFMEMDGDLGGKTKDGIKYTATKHSKKKQQINDGIFKAYVEKYHPKAKLIRLKKERVLEEGVEYLKQDLKSIK